MWSQSLLIEVLSEKKCSWFGFMRCQQNSFWTTEKSPRTNDAWFATQWNKDPPLYPSPHLYQLYLHGRVWTRDLIHTSHVVLIPLDQSTWGVYKFEKKSFGSPRWSKIGISQSPNGTNSRVQYYHALNVPPFFSRNKELFSRKSYCGSHINIARKNYIHLSFYFIFIQLQVGQH